MTTNGIVLGILFFTVLVIAGKFVKERWCEFRDLEVGDKCGRFVEDESSYNFQLEDIIKIDTDENGYTRKIYTKEGEYSFLTFLRDNIRGINGD